MKEMTPGLELPNDQRPPDYDQKFVKAPAPKPGPCNEQAKKAPSLGEAMKGMTKRG